jgi:hypothetical protein
MDFKYYGSSTTPFYKTCSLIFTADQNHDEQSFLQTVSHLVETFPALVWTSQVRYHVSVLVARSYNYVF